MIRKIISIILIAVVMVAYTSNITYAIDNIVQDAESFIASRETEGGPLNEGELKNTSNYLYNILFTIAIILAFAIGLIIGIQFILGSAEEQAKVKETLVPYVIGVFVVFASFTIWKIVVEIGNDVSPTPGSKIVAEEHNRQSQNVSQRRELIEKYNDIVNKSEATIRGMNSMALTSFKNKINQVLQELDDTKNSGIITQAEWNEMSEKVMEKLQIVILVEATLP